MSGRVTAHVGSFTVGEVPVPLEYQFLTSSDDPINLTGFADVEFRWGLFDIGVTWATLTTGPATVTAPVSGIVTYVWQGPEFQSTGAHVGQFFVSNGTTTYASLLLTWDVCA